MSFSMNACTSTVVQFRHMPMETRFLQGQAIAEEEVVDTGGQEEYKDFKLGPCKNLHGHMKSFDHGSVQVPWPVLGRLSDIQMFQEKMQKQKKTTKKHKLQIV